MHGTNKEYENNYKLKEYKDLNGKKILDTIINVAKKKNEGYVNWRFLDPINKKEDRKTGYLKVFEPYNLIIVAADYISRIEKELKKEALDRIRKITYANDGYILFSI